MATATLTEKGQITIPSKIRKLLGLEAHQQIMFVAKKGSVELIPVKGNLLDLYGVFHSTSAKPVEDWQVIREQVRQKLVKKRSDG